MRMYLSSFRMGNHPDQLLALLDAPVPADIAVIANATDDQPPDRRAAGVRRETEALHSIGLRPAEIDLRAYFGRPREDVEAAFAPYPAVWVRGGNVFMLRHALARSGADAVLGARLRRDDLVYGGYSAGACVLAPSLRGLEQCDDPNAVTETYGDPVTWDGLGLLDHVVVPHIDSPGHPESEVLGRVAADYRAKGIAHRTLRDGQVLVAKDGRTRVC